MKTQYFDTWEEAWDYCREANHPIIVTVPIDDRIECAKIFPSGHTKTLYTNTNRGG